MLALYVRRSLPLLLAGCLALPLSACTGDPAEAPPAPATATPTATPSPVATPTATPAPTATPPPTPTPSPTPTPTATPAPTATPSPSPTPTATPSAVATPTATPTPTATASPSPTPTATPTATATLTPLITAEDLGIREVDTAEALAAAGLTHVRYAAGEEAPWEAGLFLLDVESGEVEGWVGSDYIAVSPGNRLVSWAGERVLYDRHTGRTFALDSSAVEFDRWWGAGTNERLLFRLVSSGAFLLMDAEMQPVARFELPPGERFISPNGGYILVHEPRSSGTFHLLNLKDETNARMHTWTLPWEPFQDRDSGQLLYGVQVLDELVAIVGHADYGVCRVSRYSLSGALLSDRTIPCAGNWPGGIGYPRVSPDGNLVVAAPFPQIANSSDSVLSILNARTGNEILRVKSLWNGAMLGGSWLERTLDDVWLADSSGIVVGTPRGPRIVTLNGAWEWAPGRPSPVDAGLFYSVFDALPAVMNRAGALLASVSFGPRAPILGWDRGTYSEARTDWGATSDTLRIRPVVESGILEGPDRWPPLPLAPVIERPPFDDRLFVEVVVDTCLNLREAPSLTAPILTCLSNGAVAETDDFVTHPQHWMHLRTAGGLEGWASAEYLRWHSDGVRLEESPGPFTTVAVGGHYDACALTEAGEAVCWNANDPGATATLPGRYSAIDAAEGTTCAVTEEGEAVCWRSDESASEAPPGRYTAISTTPGYTCALTEAGEAVCWGSHSERAREQRAQDGDADSSSWPQQWMPDPPPGTYLAIAVGHSYYLDGSLRSACAAKASGGFVCWRSSTKYTPDERGDVWQVEGDAAGTLIDGDFCAVNGFGDPDCDLYGSSYTAISDGGSHTCAVTVGGTARCWASGIDAQTWGALSMMRPPNPSPARYVSVSTDGDYGCAVTDTGEAVCWEAQRNMTAPPDPSPGRYVAVSDGTNHTCALTDAGEAVCWGWNNHGQTDVPPGRYTAISAGEFHSCALTEAGDALCWGRIFPDPPEETYAAISTGWYEYGGSACALTEAGEVVCWGDEPHRPEPPMDYFMAIDVSERHSCALTLVGEAVCWGDYWVSDHVAGRYTAIGVGGGRTCGLTEAGEAHCWDRNGDSKTDTPSGHYAALAAARNHACALTDAGEVVCWTWEYTRYKDGDPVNPHADELAKPPPGRYVAISASEYRACAVTVGGEVVCWGDVEYTTTPRWLSLI